MSAQKKVLVVEDETIVSMEVQQRLNVLGYEVCGAALTGEEAIQIANEARPDLVLMDIMLQGRMDGVEAAAQIRESLDIPVVFLTAHSDEATLQRAKVTEPFGYILKPFDERNLNITIEMALYRNEMERQSKKQQQLFGTILRSIGDGVIATDPQGRITFMNSAAETITGWAQNEAVEQELTVVFNIMDIQQQKPIENPVQKVLKEGTVFGLTNHTLLITKDLKEKHIIECAAPIKDEKDNILGVVLVFSDITDRKKLEEQFHQAQKMESFGLLAGGIAHDFNNVLGAILGYASFMKTRIKEQHSFYKYIDTIENSARRGADLTAKLLSFSRGEKGKMKATNINDIVNETLKIIRRTFDKKIEIITYLDEKIPTINADDGQAIQLLMNLCINARDAMPTGGKLIIETGTTELDGHCVSADLEAKAGSYSWVSITDTGVGMNKETLRRIYEPFFTTKGEGKGTGLGLSVVYGVVKNHGGYISVYSELGEGTVFKVYLPNTDCAKKKPTRKCSQPRGGDELILVVDDEEYIRSFLKDSLEDYGYKVILAEDGEKAIEALSTNNGNIDLVILDLAMPRMGGRETYLKMKEINPKVKALISTGYSQYVIPDEILASGTRGYVQKPYRVNDLLLKMRQLLDDKKHAKTTSCKK